MLREVAASDLDQVVQVHCAAFPRSAMTKLGKEAIKRYYLWQLIGPYETYTTGAWADSRLMGFCFGGIHPTAISGFLAKNKGFLAWRLLTHPWLVANPVFRDRLTQGLKILTDHTPRRSPPQAAAPAKRPFDILSIAVHPDAQGQGIGKLLLARAEQQAAQNDFHVMTLFVNVDNEQAIHFYERCSWQRSNHRGVWRGTMVKWLKRDDAQATVEHSGSGVL